LWWTHHLGLQLGKYPKDRRDFGAEDGQACSRERLARPKRRPVGVKRPHLVPPTNWACCNQAQCLFIGHNVRPRPTEHGRPVAGATIRRNIPELTGSRDSIDRASAWLLASAARAS